MGQAGDCFSFAARCHSSARNFLEMPESRKSHGKDGSAGQVSVSAVPETAGTGFRV
jgi:hypothetical protein